MKNLYSTLVALIVSGGILACLTLALLYQATGQDGTRRPSSQPKRQPNNPAEVGDVAWGRDLDAALKASRTSSKPVFALFQEVPG